MKNMANFMTVSRIVFAIIILFTSPFSTAFWICYLLAGLSDMFDGSVARIRKQESNLGARLDSIADLIFASIIAAVAVIYFLIPLWLWVCIILIALLRFTGYAIGYLKYHTFSALHTYSNKISGVLLFAFPIIYITLGINIGGILVCGVTAISAMEELLITIRSKCLNRDCKSIFSC